MKYIQHWTGIRPCSDGTTEEFPATVPGNIQLDYGNYRGFSNVQYSDNYKQYLPLENDCWEYRTTLAYEKKDRERVFFVSGGIDYQYDILLNGSNLYSYEGMYRKVDLDLTDRLVGNDTLTVRIYPHPKRVDAPEGTRDEADESCKPPVCYGWDWHPRLLVSGMWQDAYIETRDEFYIDNVEVLVSLNDEMTEGCLRASFTCEKPCTISLYDRNDTLMYEGSDTEFTIANPNLWWCNGQGTPYLYRWVIRNEKEERSGKIGFRKLRLVRNIGAKDPREFPKSRYDAPITIELNGRRILAKGSNFVNPEIFRSAETKELYDELLTLAKDAHMNLLRMWGGACACKDTFYDLCDEYGILVWQEFMLACNNYIATEHYMKVLESEASALILALRHHPCLALWCGGNELFNGWSGMTDQSHALRLLNKLCFELDYDRPFLATSPLVGMAHGGYRFFDEKQGGDIFHEFQRASNTAYTEFGVPSSASIECLKKIIPEDELFPIEPTNAWIAHHAFSAWGPDAWLCLPTLEKYFGKPTSLEDIVEQSNWLQCAGYQAAFEEMRKQRPHCSMMLNWCYNEPWITAGNNSIISYPATPKPSYEFVKSALRPTLFSARISKFDWSAGEVFEAELWLLNDSPKTVSGKVHARLQIGNEIIDLLEWYADAEKNANRQGPTVRQILPNIDTDRLVLSLESGERSSSYCLLYHPKKASKPKQKILNQ